MSRQKTNTPARSATGNVYALPGAQMDIAGKFRARNIGKLVYVVPEKQWQVWDGAVWRPDRTNHVGDMVREYLCKFSLGAAGSEGMLRALASERSLAAIVRILQNDRHLTVDDDIWDTDPFLLCTPGGTVELGTGTVRPAKPDDYCRKIATVAPAPAGTPLGPLFRKVLEHVAAGDADVERYMQKVAGYCLTAVQYEKAFFIVVGESDSGKTTLFETFVAVMGDYATVTNVESFLEDPRHFRTSTNDLAEIRDYRLVVTGEPDESTRLSASRIKRLVGGDSNRSRLLYRQSVTGSTPYKCVMHCNEIPRLGSGGQAVKNRLYILPGGKSIPKAEQIADLKERLRDEYPAILRWMIDGAVLWFAERLGKPPAAAMAKASAYYRDNDPLAAWLDDRTERKTDSWHSTQELHADYEAHARENGRTPLYRDSFGKALAELQWETVTNGKPSIDRLAPSRRRVNGSSLQSGFSGLKLKPIAPEAVKDGDGIEY